MNPGSLVMVPGSKNACILPGLANDFGKNPVESFGSSIFSGGPPILIHEVRILRRVEHSDIILFAT